MNIHDLYIKEYNVLNEFRIDFNRHGNILIGVNGSGKSTVLEALAIIFHELAIIYIAGSPDKQASFEYEMKYNIWQREKISESISSGEVQGTITNILIEIKYTYKLGEML